MNLGAVVSPVMLQFDRSGYQYRNMKLPGVNICMYNLIQIIIPQHREESVAQAGPPAKASVL